MPRLLDPHFHGDDIGNVVSLRGLKCSFLLILILFACLPGISRAADSIRFWTALPSADESVMRSLVDDYNTQHDSRPVEYKNFPSRQELLQALTGQDTPEIALVDSRWLGDLKDKLTPADDVLKRAGEMVRAVAQADTFKQIWNTCTVDGKIYAIPFSAETAALLINPHYFKKIPKISTVNQWEILSLQIHHQAAHAWGAVLPYAWEPDQLAELWVTYIQTLTPKPINLHDELAGLNRWWSFTNRTQTTPLNPPSLPENFSEAATWIVAPRQVESLSQKPTVELLPKGKKFWGYLDVEALAFFDANRSWDFANYLTDYPQLKSWAMKTPTVPVDKQVFLSPDYIHDMDTRRPWMRTFITAILRVTPTPALAHEEQWDTIGKTILANIKKELPTQNAALKIHYQLFNAQKQADTSP